MPRSNKPGRGQIAIIALTASTIALAALWPWHVKTAATVTDARVELPNYDIRQDKLASEKLAMFRARLGDTVVGNNNLTTAMLLAEKTLRNRIPSLKTERHSDLKMVEVIATDVQMGGKFLTSASNLDRPTILKNFLSNNAAVIGADKAEIAGLSIVADYTNPDGGLSFVKLAQEIDGIPVFQGEISAGFTKKGELIRVVNNAAPGVDNHLISKDFGDPSNAVLATALSLGVDGSSLISQTQALGDNKAVFGTGDSATTAEKTFFPTEHGVIVPAWRVLVWLPSSAYYIVVDAVDGQVLWRKNLTEHQTQPATYSVYTRPGSMLNAAANPFPRFPGTGSPNGEQGAPLARSSVTLVGNEAPYSFNHLGWLSDAATTTDGNAVQAGIDRDGTDGIDSGSEAISPARDFTFNYNPLDPNTNTGQNPVPVPQTYPVSQFQQGVLTQLFYVTNRFHDEAYRLGFNEAAGNFQNVNFTGHGVAGDRLLAEAQDSATDANNANFTTAADGVRGRMQLSFFNAPNPDIDTSLDSSVVIHELTHGLSNRLHGNSVGLFNDMSRAMGEGWSDFYALSMLSSPTDDPLGIYTIAGYATYLAGGNTNNSYYGIRRFPTAALASTGGPLNRPHNPLTFADMDLLDVNLTDGAYEPQNNNGNPDAVHRSGEIWCSILWEIRHRFITRLGWEAGNRRMLQFVTDGMKLAPISPTFLSERDAIIAATFASGTAADLDDMWAGFASRGLGASASIEDVGGISVGGTGRTRVTEAFDLPNLKQEPDIVADDTTGDNDGFVEPGETIRLTIPITNSTGRTASNVTLQVTGGGTAVYGTLAGSATDTDQVTFSVPAAVACNSVISVELSVSSSLGPITFTRQIFVGKPMGPATFSQNFDGVTAPAIPAGWTATAISGGVNFVTSTASPDTEPNALFTPGLATVGGGTDLTSPLVAVTSTAATVTFRNNYNTEEDWDGGVLEISIAGAPFKDILAAGGTFTQNGYNGVVGPGTNNPIANRAAWTGNSGGYVTTVASLPASAYGKVVQLKWRFGADNNTAKTGWRIDTFQLAGAGFVSNFICSQGSVSLEGTLFGPGQIPLRNAPVTIVDRLGLYRFNTISGSAGEYKFPAIPRGDNYTIRVNSKRYRFPARNVSVSNDNVAGINITGTQ